MSATGRISQIALPVRDIGRAVAFYRDVVRLPVMLELPNLAFLDCGGLRLMLGIAEGERDRGGSVIYYAVDDVRVEHDAIVGRGAQAVQLPHAVGRMGATEVWMAFYEDSEGNTFALTSEHPVTVDVGARHGATLPD